MLCFMKQFIGLCLIVASALLASCEQQIGLPSVLVREAPLIRFPGVSRLDKKNAIDCNSPAHWDGQTFYLFNSYGQPWRIVTSDLSHLTPTAATRLPGDIGGRKLEDLYIWLESTWKDSDGTLYGWYHYEPDDVCAPKSHLPTSPKIGALRSKDNGANWEHLGIVIEAPPDSDNCSTSSRWDAGGHGDFSVIADGKREFLYFLFSSYVKEFAEQGVGIARMRYADRDNPAGKVHKWHKGAWTELGLGGRLTPVFSAKIDWHGGNADLFWGPSVHWNTHLNTYVVLLNHAVNSAMKGDGTYVTFNDDIGNPTSWTEPRQILTPADIESATKGGDPTNAKNYGWYPQVIGVGKGETDKLAGQVARLFIAGMSRRELVFSK